MEVLRVQKWGNSQGIRLPKKILKDLKIDINDKIEIRGRGEWRRSFNEESIMGEKNIKKK